MKISMKVKNIQNMSRNSTMRFSKYELYNKLLVGVTLVRVTPDIS